MPFLLVPLVLFYIWRPWLHLRGEKWEPNGHWVPRTAASAEYLERTQGPPTLRQRVGTYVLLLVFVVYGVALMIWGIPWLESLNDR